MFKKILVANRGEIACRVFKTARRMGIATVAIYSEADRRALHVAMADESVLVGPAPASQSYLNIDAILAACRSTGACAVHPGYGFLSERVAFAQALAEAGIAFIGPSVAAMGALGDKIEAKRVAREAGVSIVPGSIEAVETLADAERVTREIGLPVMIKAAAGGGGKGMRVVRHDAELGPAFSRARTEAMAAFGDDRVLMEKFIERPRHLEVQVLGDKHGKVVHLGERECSIQRRHQKLIEEAPSPLLDQATRDSITGQAVALAASVGYDSAGTVEFVADDSRQFFFLEMNTRLQVEHPVTELTTGVDLVEQMILAASGEPLDLEQHRIRFRGWSIETRVIAEDPVRDFAPSTGRLQAFQPADETVTRERIVRVDTGVAAGSEIPVHYDGLMAKLVTWAPDRASAIAAQREALDRFIIDGVSNNLALLAAVMASKRWQAGRLSTHFLAEEYAGGFVEHMPTGDLRRRFIAAAAAIDRVLEKRRRLIDPARAFADGPDERRAVMLGDERVNVLCRSGQSLIVAFPDGSETTVASSWMPNRRVWTGTIDGTAHAFALAGTADRLRLRHGGCACDVRILAPRQADLAAFMLDSVSAARAETLGSPMPGVLASIHVAEGQAVQAGDLLCSVEAMKMEIAVRADRDGVIGIIHAREGDRLDVDTPLLDFV